MRKNWEKRKNEIRKENKIPTEREREGGGGVGRGERKIESEPGRDGRQGNSS